MFVLMAPDDPAIRPSTFSRTQWLAAISASPVMGDKSQTCNQSPPNFMKNENICGVVLVQLPISLGNEEPRQELRRPRYQRKRLQLLTSMMPVSRPASASLPANFQGASRVRSGLVDVPTRRARIPLAHSSRTFVASQRVNAHPFHYLQPSMQDSWLGLHCSDIPEFGGFSSVLVVLTLLHQA